MKILSDKDVSVKTVGETAETSSIQCQLTFKEKQINVLVEGAVLEACVQWKDHYLVFLTDDIPNEDMLHIHLLDENLSLLDSASIGSPYATGNFRSFEMKEPDEVNFRFIGEADWSVKLLQKKKLHIPFVSDPKGVFRKLKFHSYFEISGDPRSESASPR